MAEKSGNRRQFLFQLTMAGASAATVNSWAQEAVDDYTRRLRRHGGVDETWVKHEAFRGDVDAVRRAEADRLLLAAGLLTPESEQLQELRDTLQRLEKEKSQPILPATF